MQTEEYARLFEHEDSYWWFVGRRRLALALLDQALSGKTGGQVLDLGCGTGAVLANLAQRHESFGLDFSALALEFCAKRGLERLTLGNGERLPFRDAQFDAIVALDIIEHIHDDRAAFAEAYRVLKPGGVLVMSVPAFRWLWGPHDIALMHQRRYTRAEVRSRLTSAGFVPERLSYSVFALFPAVVMVRLRDKLRRGPAKVALPVISPGVNRWLIRVQDREAKWSLKHSLPWGSSVVAVGRKPAV